MQRLFDVETLRRLDVLEVDSAEGRLQNLAGADDFVGVLGVQLDVEDVDIGEALEEDRLAFHHRLARQRTDISEPEHRRAIRYHADQIALRRIFVGEAGIAFDLQARNGNARSVSEAEIPLGAACLGRRYR